MKKFILIFTFSFLLPFAAFAATVTASTTDPSDIGVGARPLALGKSFVGYSDDASDIFINPAGLADITSQKATSMSGQVMEDLNYVVLSGASPTDWGTFGIGYVNVGMDAIPLTTITGAVSSEEVVPAGSTAYYSTVLTLSYSNDLSKIDFLSDYKNITYGINLKYFMQGFNGGGDLMQGATGTGQDMDVALQYKQSKALTLGFSAINILPESLGGKFVWQKDNVTENIPSLIKIGGMAKVFGADSYLGGNQNVSFSLDMDMTPTQNRQSVYHSGIEWWPISVMALRAGIDQKPMATEDGTGTDNNLTAGIGLKFNGFTFDYCYHQFSDLTENTTQFFSIGYVGDDEQKKAVDKPTNILTVTVPKVGLKSFPDVPSNYWAKSPIEFMATLGVMNGFYDGKFRPDDSVSRAELATMMVKLKGLEANEVNSDPYPDVSKDYWAAKDIKAVSYLDLMTNYPDGEFKPEKKLTRLEAAVILEKFTEAPEPSAVDKDPFVDLPHDHWAAKYVKAASDFGLLDYLIGKKFEPDKEISRAEIAELLSKTTSGKDKIRQYLKAGS